MEDIPDGSKEWLVNLRDVLLVSSWINVFLYTTELALIVYAYTHLKLSRFHQNLVVTSLLVDTACTAIVCYNFWLFVIVEAVQLGMKPWTIGATIMLTYTSAALGHIYFMHRYWAVARNTIVSGLILLGIVVHVVFGFISAIYVFVIPEVRRNFGNSAAIVAATASASTDVLIAGSTFWTLRRIETVSRSMQSLLVYMSRLAIGSGFIAATGTVLMIVFLFASVLNGFNLIFYCLGRIYTITILVNWILLKNHNAKTPSTSLSRSQSTGSRSPRARIGTDFNTTANVAFAPIELQTFTVPDFDASLDDSDPWQHSVTKSSAMEKGALGSVGS